ncbi:hypothetical protein C9374_011283 [Naegleria lovaniensis]|uniref:Fe2OG dioxygenase domain-containing protein n=1 Tax=Naegleria lovaniensis TaxID=51637 RepID=A0AA88KNW0_NAELO|nr:uncharacterized protein C9374_011283 [Naegleria lovaniensis]KAG2392558.1 hypothetical protein C9374_011283 [Naegleria lovaniensis]
MHPTTASSSETSSFTPGDESSSTTTPSTSSHSYYFVKPKDETVPTPYLFITNVGNVLKSEEESKTGSELHKLYEDWIIQEVSENVENVEVETVMVREQKLKRKKKEKLERKKQEASSSDDHDGPVHASHPTIQIYVVFGDSEEAERVKNYLNSKHPVFHVSYADTATETKEQRKKKHIKGWNIECTSSTEHVKIPGLLVIENFITEEEEEKIIKQVDQHEWVHELQRRVQHYGFKFDYDIRSIDFNANVDPIPEYVQNIIPRMKDLLNTKQQEKDPSFENDEYLSSFDFASYQADQLTINEYQPGQGIRPHIDVHGPFNDGLFLISLLSSTVMYFSKCVNDEVIEKKYVDLPRRSLAVIVGEARYLWRHAIMCRELDRVNGKIRKRQRRVSLTIRSVRKSGSCKCKWVEVCDSQQQDYVAHNLPYSQQLSTTNLELEFVQKTYNTIASHWDNTRHYAWPKVAEFIKSLPDYSVVGDIGCGNGKYIGLNPKCIWIATDRSEKLCEICVQKGFDVTVSDALNLPYKTNCFDATLNIAVLHHISSVARRIRLLKELVRVTKPNGLILIYAWSFEQEQSSKRKFQSQDVFVPWKLQAKYLSHGEEQDDDNESQPPIEDNEVTIKRYCHVYKQGELDELLLTKVKGVDIVDSYFDTGNWCLLVRKHKSDSA